MEGHKFGDRIVATGDNNFFAGFDAGEELQKLGFRCVNGDGCHSGNLANYGAKVEPITQLPGYLPHPS